MSGYDETGMNFLAGKSLREVTKRDLMNHMLYVHDLELRAAQVSEDTYKRYRGLQDLSAYHGRQYKEELKHWKLQKHRLAEEDIDFQRYETSPETKEMFEAYYQYETPAERLTYFNYGQERTSNPSVVFYGNAAIAKILGESANMIR